MSCVRNLFSRKRIRSQSSELNLVNENTGNNSSRRCAGVVSAAQNVETDSNCSDGNVGQSGRWKTSLKRVTRRSSAPLEIPPPSGAPAAVHLLAVKGSASPAAFNAHIPPSGVQPKAHIPPTATWKAHIPTVGLGKTCIPPANPGNSFIPSASPDHAPVPLGSSRKAHSASVTPVPSSAPAHPGNSLTASSVGKFPPLSEKKIKSPWFNKAKEECFLSVGLENRRVSAVGIRNVNPEGYNAVLPTVTCPNKISFLEPTNSKLPFRSGALSPAFSLEKPLVEPACKPAIADEDKLTSEGTSRNIGSAADASKYASSVGHVTEDKEDAYISDHSAQDISHDSNDTCIANGGKVAGLETECTGTFVTATSPHVPSKVVPSPAVNLVKGNGWDIHPQSIAIVSQSDYTQNPVSPLINESFDEFSTIPQPKQDSKTNLGASSSDELASHIEFDKVKGTSNLQVLEKLSYSSNLDQDIDSSIVENSSSALGLHCSVDISHTVTGGAFCTSLAYTGNTVEASYTEKECRSTTVLKSSEEKCLIWQTDNTSGQKTEDTFAACTGLQDHDHTLSNHSLVTAVDLFLSESGSTSLKRSSQELEQDESGEESDPDYNIAEVKSREPLQQISQTSCHNFRVCQSILDSAPHKWKPFQSNQETNVPPIEEAIHCSQQWAIFQQNLDISGSNAATETDPLETALNVPLPDSPVAEKASNLDAGQDTSEPDTEAITAGNNTVTAGNNTITAGNNTVTAGNNTITAGNNTVTARNNTVTAGNNTVTAGNNTVTAGNNTITAGNNTVTAGNNTVTARNNTVTAGNNTVTAGNNTITAGNNTVTAGNNRYTQINSLGVKHITAETHTSWMESTASIKNDQQQPHRTMEDISGCSSNDQQATQQPHRTMEDNSAHPVAMENSHDLTLTAVSSSLSGHSSTIEIEGQVAKGTTSETLIRQSQSAESLPLAQGPPKATDGVLHRVSQSATSAALSQSMTPGSDHVSHEQSNSITPIETSENVASFSQMPETNGFTSFSGTQETLRTDLNATNLSDDENHITYLSPCLTNFESGSTSGSCRDELVEQDDVLSLQADAVIKLPSQTSVAESEAENVTDSEELAPLLDDGDIKELAELLQSSSESVQIADEADDKPSHSGNSPSQGNLISFEEESDVQNCPELHKLHNESSHLNVMSYKAPEHATAILSQLIHQSYSATTTGHSKPLASQSFENEPSSAIQLTVRDSGKHVNSLNPFAGIKRPSSSNKDVDVVDAAEEWKAQQAALEKMDTMKSEAGHSASDKTAVKEREKEEELSEEEDGCTVAGLIDVFQLEALCHKNKLQINAAYKRLSKQQKKSTILQQYVLQQTKEKAELLHLIKMVETQVSALKEEKKNMDSELQKICDLMSIEDETNARKHEMLMYKKYCAAKTSSEAKTVLATIRNRQRALHFLEAMTYRKFVALQHNLKVEIEKAEAVEEKKKSSKSSTSPPLPRKPRKIKDLASFGSATTTNTTTDSTTALLPLSVTPSLGHTSAGSASAGMVVMPSQQQFQQQQQMQRGNVAVFSWPGNLAFDDVIETEV